MALLERADALLGQALDKDPNSMPIAHLVRGHTAFERGDYNASARHYRAALQCNAKRKRVPGAEGDVLNDSEIYNQLGLTYQKMEKHEAALKVWGEGIRALPRAFELWANAAALHANRGEYVKAMELYAEAVEIEPNSPSMINNIGWLSELQGNLHDAATYYRRAHELQAPNTHPQILTNIRNVEERLKLSTLQDPQAVSLGQKPAATEDGPAREKIRRA